PFSLLWSANLASLLSYFVVFAIFRRLGTTLAAKWGLLLFAAYPFAFFQSAGYAESFMVLFSALAILLALKGRHLWAGVALGFGVLARHLSLFAGAALFFAQVRERGFHPRKLLASPSILGLLLPLVPPLAFIWFVGRRFGDPLIFWHAREKEFGFAYQ